MINLKALFLSFFFITTFISIAQQRRIDPARLRQIEANLKQSMMIGAVINNENNQPVEFATIGIFNQADSSLVTGNVTNAEGRFRIPIEKPGIYYTKIEFIGFDTKFVSNLEVGETPKFIRVGRVQLGEKTEILEEIEIVAEKSQSIYSLDKRVYNVESDLSNLSNNASDILDNIPSVQVDVEGNVSLRGSENVRILVDGKPSGLAGIGSTDALRNLPSDLIERIEVITNPSARYDAEGEAGIINIVLKKDQKKGINGSVTVNAGYPENFGTSINLNRRAGKFNTFLTYSFRYRNTPGNGGSNQVFTEEDTTFSFIRDLERSRSGFSNTVRGGFDFFLDDKTTLTFSGLYSISDQETDVDINNFDFDSNGDEVQRVNRFQLEGEDDTNLEFDFSLRKEFARPGQRFDFDFKWTDNDDVETADIIEDNLTNENVEDIIQRTSNTENQQTLLIQADYVEPFTATSKLEVGLKSTNRVIDNNFLAEEQNASGEFIAISQFNNQFIYDEWIHAAYIQYASEFSDFKYQIGLRSEFSDIETRLSESPEDEADREFIDFFPSAFLSKEISDQSSLKLSYSRRISRPRFRLLLPFSNFSDSRNFFSGNPDLNPEYTNSVEVEYVTNRDKGSFLTNVYYRRRNNVIQRITVVDSINNDFSNNFPFINRIFPVNLATESSVGWEVSVSYDVAKFLTFNFNSNLFYSEVEGEFEGEDFGNETFSWNSRFVSRWDLPADMKLQASLRYIAPRQTAQGERLSITSIDLGLSKDILKDKGTLTIGVSDLLNDRRRRSIIEGENFITRDDFQWRERQWTMTLSYRFNEDKNDRRRGRGDRGGYGGGGDDGGDF
ncbi:MAG: outer membrane beta-barrel family protein [Bacteroidota bacterium]